VLVELYNYLIIVHAKITLGPSWWSGLDTELYNHLLIVHVKITLWPSWQSGLDTLFCIQSDWQISDNMLSLEYFFGSCQKI
jgi:hypothetical protein